MIRKGTGGLDREMVIGIGTGNQERNCDFEGK